MLHTGLGPDAASSGFMAQVIGVAIELGGMPVPRGGGVSSSRRCAGIVEDAGGACETGRDVERIRVSGGRATGVQTADGEVIEAARAVLANVTPQQLYGDLLGQRAGRGEARRFRFGRGEMQIHFALSEPPALAGRRAARPHGDRPPDARPRRRLARGQRGRARLPPAEATVVVGQPMAVDPSRAPGRLVDPLDPAPGDPVAPEGRRGGRARHDRRPGRRRCARRTPTGSRRGSRGTRRTSTRPSSGASPYSPADIEAANVNMVGGDIYAGSCALDQNLLWRPRPGLPGHRTHVEGLWHIGASTHPGPGLGAGSGTLVAKELLRRRRFR